VVNASAGEECDFAGGSSADAGLETTNCDTDCTVAFEAHHLDAAKASAVESLKAVSAAWYARGAV
jgi:hypothetical protein